MTKKSSAAIVGVALFLLSLIPTNHTIVKPWVVTVTDEQGKPVAGAKVTEIWQNYSLEWRDHEEELATHVDGNVYFPARTIRSSLAQRFLGCLKQIGFTGVHTSCGDSSQVLVERHRDYRDLDEAVYDIREGRGHGGVFVDAKTSHFILHK